MYMYAFSIERFILLYNCDTVKSLNPIKGINGVTLEETQLTGSILFLYC